MDGLVLVEKFTGTWGPAALIAIVILLLVMGKLRTEKSVNEQIEALKDFYEGRIDDLKSGHVERLEEVRKSRDTLSDALQGAVDNVSKLIAQVDELQELARVATPVIVAQREAAEHHE